MGHIRTHFVKVEDKQVGYSAKQRGKRWAVTYPDPLTGKRQEKVTTAEVRGQHPGADFHEQAADIIRRHYQPPTLFPVTKRLTWDEAIGTVEKSISTVRPETLRSFKAAANMLVATCPDATDPAYISEERVTRFKREFLAAPSKKGKGGGRRSPTTLSYYCRALSALSNHLIDLDMIRGNPWKGTRIVKGERRKKDAPTEDQITRFMGWITSRYPDWQTLHLFLETKLVAGCRTADLCKLPTAALVNDRLTFPPSTTKTKDEFTAILPAVLAAKLRDNAGRFFLWGKLFADIPQYRKQSNGLPDQFDAKSVYYVVNNIFREFNEAHPADRRLTPHDFRRRAITLTLAATNGNVDITAQARGLNPTTARNHYIDWKKALDAEAVQRQVAELLLPGVRASRGGQEGE